jgi:hypothetical protein
MVLLMLGLKRRRMIEKEQKNEGHKFPGKAPPILIELAFESSSEDSAYTGSPGDLAVCNEHIGYERSKPRNNVSQIHDSL